MGTGKTAPHIVSLSDAINRVAVSYRKEFLPDPWPSPHVASRGERVVFCAVEFSLKLCYLKYGYGPYRQSEAAMRMSTKRRLNRLE